MAKKQQFSFIDASRFSKWSKLIKSNHFYAQIYQTHITRKKFEWLNPISEGLSHSTVKEVVIVRRMLIRQATTVK
ncbi:hypothetical protein LOAG_19079 [Loa loa]|uniref:Uncharacterized protein n=1 Tax=Loa loa TaxID=7209 RepID=A0A1S0UCY3_LOALO|nr:hypothetical protein LOAG_19079 [Loa loa]EJD73502.1 hypothetical protein LOAG_19079 [Loa loa]